MIIGTLFYTGDLPKAMILAESVRKFMPDARLVACLVEKEIPHALRNQTYFDDVILAKDLGFENFDKFIFKFKASEAADVVKGQFFTYLMGEFTDEDIFIFLDPDIEVFGPFEELLSALRYNDIVVLPHLCKPEDQLEAIADNELWALRNGVYDLGCLAIKRSMKADALIEWWKVRLDKFCYEDILDGTPMGVFTEQRWFCLVPGFFDIHIFKHEGYNFGPRNLSTRNMTVQEEEYLVNGQPLRFCHFWGVESGKSDEIFNKYLPDLSNPAYALRDSYRNRLKEMAGKVAGDTDWTYSYYTNGEKITDEVRDTFRMEPWRADKVPSPFELSNNDFTNDILATTKALLSGPLSETKRSILIKAFAYYQKYGIMKTLAKISEKCLRR